MERTKDSLIERTIIILKPEGRKQGLLGEITNRLTAKGLSLVAVKSFSDDSNASSDEINTGQDIAMVFQGVGAIDETRFSLGDISVNNLHWAESQDSAEKDISLRFTEEELALTSQVDKIEEKNSSRKEFL